MEKVSIKGFLSRFLDKIGSSWSTILDKDASTKAAGALLPCNADSYLSLTVVDRAGFEPAASALRTRRSYRADLPAPLGAFGKNSNLSAFRAFG